MRILKELDEVVTVIPSVGGITSFFNMIYNLCSEFQTAGNVTIFSIAGLLIAVPLMVGDDESKARARKRIPWVLLGAAIFISVFNIAANAGNSLKF